MQAYYDKVKNLPIGQERLWQNEPMAKHTTFRIGGPADLFFSAATVEEILLIVRTVREESIPLTVVGNGSNLLVSDQGIRGMVLCIGRDYQRVTVEGDYIRAQAGASLKSVAQKALEASLGGLEAISGIPGNVGGAVCMNAGAYGSAVADHLVSVTMLDPHTGDVETIPAEAMDFGYRTSRAMKEKKIVLEALWKLPKSKTEDIRAAMDDYTGRRREKQPLAWPSAGSVFKRPEGYFAGKLIEDAGLKGYTIGGAQVSELHAGFIINIGGATARDVDQLIEHIQKIVWEKFSVALETEIRRIGE